MNVFASPRRYAPEILDDPSIPENLRARCYDELTSAHRRLGNIRAVVECLRRDPLPVRTVLDIGCGYGGVLHRICKELGVAGIGVDLCPPSLPSVPILQLDAIHDRLPAADVAIAMTMTHHLTEQEVIQLVRNVARSCRRLVILDLVRHPLPAVLFRSFVAPFVHRITKLDGIGSFERAFTANEMKGTIARSLAGTGGSFRHSVGPFFIRQIADISFAS